MTNWSGCEAEIFLYRDSRPWYWGVKPHFEAVLTIKTTFPL